VRLVLDTNVVMSGLLWRGKPYQLLQAIRRQHPRLQLYSSPVLLEELTDVISRPAFARQLGLIGRSAQEVLADYLEVIELVEPIEIPRIVRDPDDDHVLACALTAQADLIVSGDKDLLDLHKHQDIPIITAADALQSLDLAQP
jgi:uncharacterized protein